MDDKDIKHIKFNDTTVKYLNEAKTTLEDCFFVSDDEILKSLEPNEMTLKITHAIFEIMNKNPQLLFYFASEGVVAILKKAKKLDECRNCENRKECKDEING